MGFYVWVCLMILRHRSNKKKKIVTKRCDKQIITNDFEEIGNEAKNKIE